MKQRIASDCIGLYTETRSKRNGNIDLFHNKKMSSLNCIVAHVFRYASARRIR